MQQEFQPIMPQLHLNSPQLPSSDRLAIEAAVWGK